jgi:hypothetical protein
MSGAYTSKSKRSTRMASLAAITADQAAEQVFPAAQVRGGAGHNQSARDQILASAAAGQILNAQGAPDYAGGGQCAGASLVKPAVTGTIGSLALKFAPQAFAAGPIVGGIVVAIGAISELFTVIFGHHAAAIKKEQSILCAAVPAANQALQLIDQTVAAGQATPADAVTALNTLLSGFGQQVASIRHGIDPMSSGECNAACIEYSKLRAIVLQKASQYQDLAAAQQAAAANPVASALAPITSALAPLAPVTGAVTSAVSAASASTGIPSWILWAGGGFLLWKLL